MRIKGGNTKALHVSPSQAQHEILRKQKFLPATMGKPDPARSGRYKNGPL
jgi:hypothetical protein